MCIRDRDMIAAIDSALNEQTDTALVKQFNNLKTDLTAKYDAILSQKGGRRRQKTRKNRRSKRGGYKATYKMPVNRHRRHKHTTRRPSSSSRSSKSSRRTRSSNSTSSDSYRHTRL